MTRLKIWLPDLSQQQIHAFPHLIKLNHLSIIVYQSPPIFSLAKKTNNNIKPTSPERPWQIARLHHPLSRPVRPPRDLLAAQGWQTLEPNHRSPRPTKPTHDRLVENFVRAFCGFVFLKQRVINSGTVLI